MSCEFCGSHNSPTYTVTLGDKTSTLYVCVICQAAQIFPEFPESEVRQFYERDYFHVEPWELKKARILAFDYMRKLQRVSGKNGLRGKALEIGAGYGFFAELFEQTVGCAIDIVEPSQCCREWIEKRNLRGYIYDSLEAVQSKNLYTNIFAFHVVEHLQRLGEFLQKVSDLLELGGHLWLLTPNMSSVTFLRLRKRWGWSCPTQHYQFISTKIPHHYYFATGMEPILTKDVLPAPIHFPSYWQGILKRRIASLDKRFRNSSRIQQRLWQVVRWPAHIIINLLEQNRTNWNLCVIERFWAVLTRRRPFDELFLILEKTQSRKESNFN